MVPYLGFFYQARAKLYFRIHLLKKEEQNLQSWALLECWVRGWVRGKHFGIKIYTYYTVVEGIILTQEFFAIFFGPNFLFENSTTPFRVAATQCKKSFPERRNWPGRLAGNAEGASRISKQKKTTPLFTIIFNSSMVVSISEILVYLFQEL